MTDSTLLQIAEEIVAGGDPNGLATMIVQGKFADTSDADLRELLARAFVKAGQLERQANGVAESAWTEQSGILGGASIMLDAMALDLRYNPGKLSLIDQIYIFYPNLKPGVVPLIKA